MGDWECDDIKTDNRIAMRKYKTCQKNRRKKIARKSKWLARKGLRGSARRPRKRTGRKWRNKRRTGKWRNKRRTGKRKNKRRTGKWKNKRRTGKWRNKRRRRTNMVRRFSSCKRTLIL